MLLPGRLSATTLGDLLGMLHREQIHGQLELRVAYGIGAAREQSHRIFFESGLVSDVETALPVPRIGELLHRDGLVGAEVLRRLQRRIESGDRRSAGEILVNERLAAPEVVGMALRRQLRERLDALFALREAVVAFHPARPRMCPRFRIGPLPPSEFLHGRPRSRDLRRVWPHQRVWPHHAEAPRSWRPPTPREEPPPRSTTRVIAMDPERERAYLLLGLAPGAEEAEVRRAFRKLASGLHPDCHGKAGEAERRRLSARFAELSAAYHLLVA